MPTASLVVAPQTTSNALGRALSLATMLQHLGPTTVAARYDGPLWQGAHDAEHPILTFETRDELAHLVDRVGPTAVVIAVKPFASSLGWTSDVLASRRGAVLVMDLDDDDVAIQWGWQRRLPLRQRIATLRTSELSALRIRRAIARHLPRADLVTVSSWALRERFPPRRGPELRVPHPRELRPYAPPVLAPDGRLRIGFLGTPQRYKGVDVLARLLRARPELELHVLAGSEHRLAGTERIVRHPHVGRDTLPAAFAQVDAVVLPQDPKAGASRYQLPAKLLDALAHGRPVLATATPTITEVAGEGILTVEGWDPLAPALAALDSMKDPATRDRLGRRGHERFSASLSAETLAERFAATLAGLAPARRRVRRARARGLTRARG